MARHRKAGSAQVVFLLGSTGSIQPYISASKDGIRKIMEGKKGASGNGTLELRLLDTVTSMMRP